MKVIINADDYGLNKRKTDAIISCFKRGLIDTTTMIANSDIEVFHYSVEKLKEVKLTDRVGIHLCITSGKALTEDMRNSRFFSNTEGKLKKRLPILLVKRSDREILYKELDAQIKRMKKEGLSIHHADSHHHLHTRLFYYGIFKKVLKDNDITLLRCKRNIGKISLLNICYKYMFNNFVMDKKMKYTEYFGSIDDCLYQKVCKGNVELMCHPDYDESGFLIDRITTTNSCKNLAEVIDKIRKKVNEVV